ncbi:unnamed protein product [Trichogramma brassicae]|uniref:Uncharacterized protein n=1 Tax=Trichogramma brassicae TaxID=86971 RepID=A0A6H5HY40_9HYME|nr:unnamed protein product [Trichogramma brassicae]
MQVVAFERSKETHQYSIVLNALTATAREYDIPDFKPSKRAAIIPDYEPHLWNQREATLTGQHKTNNVSEGWHNRFRILVGKNHPDFYYLLRELQKEQADTEIAITEMCLNRRVKALPKKKWPPHILLYYTVTDLFFHRHTSMPQVILYNIRMTAAPYTPQCDALSALLCS